MKRLLLLFVLSATALAPAAAEAAAKLGTRANPYTFGATVPVKLDDDSWTLRLLSVNKNAWSVVHAANEFNSAPKSGTVFYMVKVRLRYEGKGSTSLDDGSVETVGKSNVAYTVFNPGCGVLPDDLDNANSSIFHGGAVTGNICFQVKRSDVASLELFVVPFLTGRQLFFKL